MHALELTVIPSTAKDGLVIANHLDSASGVTRFATLEGALARLKEILNSANGRLPESGVIIHLLSGTHRLEAPIRLTRAESGSEVVPIFLMGPADKSAVISGGRVLSRPSTIRDPLVLQRLPVRSRKSVVQYDLRAEGVDDFGSMIRRGWGQTTQPGQLELYYRGEPMNLARWPDRGYALLLPAQELDAVGCSFFLRGADVRTLAQDPGLMATGYWAKDWADETLAVQSVDPTTGLMTLQAPCPQFGVKAGQRVFLQNALSQLDHPGEWYLDRMSGILYFWPPGPLGKGDVEVSFLPALITTEGASHVRFWGLTFEMARGDALKINGGTDVMFSHSTIRNVGGRAANIGGSRNGLSDVDVYDTGEGGVYLWAGDRQTLTAGNLFVEHSRIRRFNRLARTYRPAIQIGGVGNRAIGNVISNGTHNAIMFFGNDHLIAFNDISNVATESGDVGAIYTGRDWTARGTVIRNNFFHDIHAPGLWGSRGVYLDDQASGIIVKGNVFVRVDSAVFIGGGRDNVVEQNLFVSSSPAIHLDARGLTWQRELTQDPNGILRKRLSEVPFNKSPYRDRYPKLASILADDTGAPKYNLINGNIIVGGTPLDLQEDTAKWTSVNELMEMSVNRFRTGTAALKSVDPLDFLVDTGALGDHERDGLPLAGMACVSQKWRSVDSDGPPIECKLH